jgi:hypothetical protein
MKLTLSQLKAIIKDVIKDVSPVGIGPVPSEETRTYDEDPVTDYDIKNAVFVHLKASGVIDVNEEPYGYQWNELEVWQVGPDDYGYADSVVVDGKHYYGEW